MIPAVSGQREDALERLEEVLGHRFADRDLLRRALRHGSADRAAEAGTYQRLEFLGDAVLGAAGALLLFERFPDADQGTMTRMRAQLIRSASLAERAARLGLDIVVEIDPRAAAGGGRERAALLEDLFEAVVGALLLDGGWGRALAFVRGQLEAEDGDLDERSLILADAKTALQEAAQARGLPLPEYREAGASGPEHSPRWAFAVLWDGEEVARGEGTTKRQAQQQAARRALHRLGLLP